LGAASGDAGEAMAGAAADAAAALGAAAADKVHCLEEQERSLRCEAADGKVGRCILTLSNPP
jgi:hypothetical protein